MDKAACFGYTESCSPTETQPRQNALQQQAG